MNKSLLIGALALAATPGVAQATFLGTTLNYQYYFANLTSPYAGADNGNKVVGAGVEVSNVADNHGTVDISATNIFVDYTNAASWTPAAFNGWVLSDLTNNVAPITGVFINGATNMVGFNASNISFTANTISVNWQNLSFTADTVVSLDVRFGQVQGAVPEPTTWAMMLAGFGIVGGTLRYRRRKTTVSFG